MTKKNKDDAEDDNEGEQYHINGICNCLEPISNQSHTLLDNAANALSSVNTYFTERIESDFYRMFKQLKLTEFTIKLKCSKCGKEYTINKKLENNALIITKNTYKPNRDKIEI